MDRPRGMNLVIYLRSKTTNHHQHEQQSSRYSKIILHPDVAEDADSAPWAAGVALDGTLVPLACEARAIAGKAGAGRGTSTPGWGCSSDRGPKKDPSETGTLTGGFTDGGGPPAGVKALKLAYT